MAMLPTGLRAPFLSLSPLAGAAAAVAKTHGHSWSQRHSLARQRLCFTDVSCLQRRALRTSNAANGGGHTFRKGFDDDAALEVGLASPVTTELATAAVYAVSVALLLNISETNFSRLTFYIQRP